MREAWTQFWKALTRIFQKWGCDYNRTHVIHEYGEYTRVRLVCLRCGRFVKFTKV